MELEKLIAKVRQELDDAEEGKTIPELCKGVGETDEYTMMLAIARLEDMGYAILNDFNRVYREDGGAIYMAKYSKRAG